MAYGFPNEAQKSKVKGWQWSLSMFIPGSDRQCSCKVKGRQCSCGNVALRSWQCSSKVVAMFLRLDAFKETKRIQHYIRLLMFFTTLQESLRLQKDIMPGLMYKDFSATFKLVGMNFCIRKRHTLMVSFLAARLRSCSRNFKTMATPRLRKIQDNCVL